MAMSRRQSQLRQGHKYVLERLSPYIDEQLQAKERARVEAHLNACPSCRKELQTLQWTMSLLRQVPPVPLPRSFVIREADLAPRRTARRAPVRQKPAFALQWATALVAILLVVVVAGDVFLGRGPAALGSQQEVAMLSAETPMVVSTVVVESEAAVEALAAEPVQENAEAETPSEAPEKRVAPPAPDVSGEEASETFEQAQVMEQGDLITGTTDAPPMMLQVAPESGTPEEQVPEQPSAKAFGSQDAATTPVPDEQGAEQPAEPPLAMAPPPDTLASEPLREPKAAERGALPGWHAQLARAGWRVAEVGLGLLLVGLIVTMVWVRRRK
jgi:hypothetical protein